jgi:hypothetical protein
VREGKTVSRKPGEAGTWGKSGPAIPNRKPTRSSWLTHGPFFYDNSGQNLNMHLDIDGVTVDSQSAPVTDAKQCIGYIDEMLELLKENMTDEIKK